MGNSWMVYFSHFCVYSSRFGHARRTSKSRTRSSSAPPTSSKAIPQSYLTKCIYYLVLESQLHHKIVNLLFAIINQNIKLTICGGVDFLKFIETYIVSDKVPVTCLFCTESISAAHAPKRQPRDGVQGFLTHQKMLTPLGPP